MQAGSSKQSSATSPPVEIFELEAPKDQDENQQDPEKQKDVSDSELPSPNSSSPSNGKRSWVWDHFKVYEVKG